MDQSAKNRTSSGTPSYGDGRTRRALLDAKPPLLANHDVIAGMESQLVLDHAGKARDFADLRLDATRRIRLDELDLFGSDRQHARGIPRRRPRERDPQAAAALEHRAIGITAGNAAGEEIRRADEVGDEAGQPGGS